MSTTSALPDLLRRFVATPYRFGVVSCSVIVSFETNDQALLTVFRAGAEELAGALASSTDRPWHWKIVRDDDVLQDNHEPLLLSGGNSSTLFLGTGTVVAVDWDRGELLGFLAANVSPQHLLDRLLDVGRQHHLNHSSKPPR